MRIIKPEMSAKVSFLAGTPNEQTKPLVIVPKKAIVGENNQTAVWIVRDGQVHLTSIVTGREFQDGVEVKQGLAGGEQVIVVPPANLKDGQSVTVVNT